MNRLIHTNFKTGPLGVRTNQFSTGPEQEHIYVRARRTCSVCRFYESESNPNVSIDIEIDHACATRVVVLTTCAGNCLKNLQRIEQPDESSCNEQWNRCANPIPEAAIKLIEQDPELILDTLWEKSS